MYEIIPSFPSTRASVVALKALELEPGARNQEPRIEL